MSDTAKADAVIQEPPNVIALKYWSSQFVANWPVFIIIVFVVSSFVGGGVYFIEENRYKDVTDGLRTQIGTQAATIQGQAAAIAQLREQLKGTSPELAAIQANRDKIRTQLQDYYVRSSELFRRRISDEPSLNTLIGDAELWASDAFQWIEAHMGLPAAEKFMQEDSAEHSNYGGSFNKEHSSILIHLAIFRRNLSTLIETAA